MNDAKLKEMICHAVDAQCAALQEDPLLGQKVLQAQKKPRRVPVKLIAAVCAVVLVLCVELLLPGGWIQTSQDEANGWYIADTIRNPAGYGSIANAQPALDRLGVYSPATWTEVVELLGYIPEIPNWAPKNSTEIEYYVGLTEININLTMAYVDTVTGETIMYMYYHFFDYDGMHIMIEQDGQGEYVTISDGRKIYTTTNMGHCTAYWSDGLTQYMISGTITYDDLLRMAESVKTP